MEGGGMRGEGEGKEGRELEARGRKKYRERMCLAVVTARHTGFRKGDEEEKGEERGESREARGGNEHDEGGRDAVCVCVCVCVCRVN